MSTDQSYFCFNGSLIFLIVIISSIIVPAVDSVGSSSSSVTMTTTVGDDQEIFGNGRINEKIRNGSGSGVNGSGVGDKSEFDQRRNVGFDGSVSSHLLHAVVGLNRYPNYLNRWNDVRDIDSLEKALEEQLSLVRKQKGRLLQMKRNVFELLKKHDLDCQTSRPKTWDELSMLFCPLARRTIFTKRFSKKYSSVMNISEVLGNRCREIELDPGPLEELIDLFCFDVYEFPLLQEKVV